MLNCTLILCTACWRRSTKVRGHLWKRYVNTSNRNCLKRNLPRQNSCLTLQIRPFQVPHQQTTRLKSNRWQQQWGRKSTAVAASTLKHMWNSPGALGCCQKRTYQTPLLTQACQWRSPAPLLHRPQPKPKTTWHASKGSVGYRTKSSKLVYNGDTKWKPCSQRSYSNSAKEQLCKRSRQYGTEIGSGFWCT